MKSTDESQRFCKILMIWHARAMAISRDGEKAGPHLICAPHRTDGLQVQSRPRQTRARFVIGASEGASAASPRFKPSVLPFSQRQPSILYRTGMLPLFRQVTDSVHHQEGRQLPRPFPFVAFGFSMKATARSALPPIIMGHQLCSAWFAATMPRFVPLLTANSFCRFLFHFIFASSPTMRLRGRQSCVH